MEQKKSHKTVIWTDLLSIGVTPEDGVAVPVVCHPYRVTFTLGWHQSSDKAPVYVGHHHITPVGEDELRHSSWETHNLQTPVLN